MSGIGSGHVAILYTDSDCRKFAGFGMSSGTEADVTLESPLELGSYTFYARAGRPLGSDVEEGISVSACSSTSVDYQVVETVPVPVEEPEPAPEVKEETVPDAPSALSLSSPASSPGESATPIIRVEGVSTGDTIMLFTNPSCGTSVDALGMNVAQGNSVDVGVSFFISPRSWKLYFLRSR